MNLSELLTASKPLAAAKPSQEKTGSESTDSENVEGGEAFLTSVNEVEETAGTSEGDPREEPNQQPPEAPLLEDALLLAESVGTNQAELVQTPEAAKFDAPQPVVNAPKQLGEQTPVGPLPPAPKVRMQPASTKAADSGQTVVKPEQPVLTPVLATSAPVASQRNSPNAAKTETIASVQATAAKVQSNDGVSDPPVQPTQGLKPDQSQSGTQPSMRFSTTEPATTMGLTTSAKPSGELQVVTEPLLRPQNTQPTGNQQPANAPVPVQIKSAERKTDVRSETQRTNADATDEPSIDLQRVERREEIAAADIKRADKTAQSQQLNAQSTPTSARSAPTTTPTVEVVQTVTSSQGSANFGPGISPREAIADRSFSTSVAATSTTDASARNTLAQITAAIRNQPLGQMVELSLDPPELGRIEIQMEVAEVGLKATLSAERSITSDLIRRQAELLQQQLNDAGFTDVDIDFRDFGAGAQDHRGAGGHASNGPSGELASSGTQPTAPAQIRMQVGLGGMDIRL